MSYREVVLPPFQAQLKISEFIIYPNGMRYISLVLVKHALELSKKVIRERTTTKDMPLKYTKRPNNLQPQVVKMSFLKSSP